MGCTASFLVWTNLGEIKETDVYLNSILALNAQRKKVSEVYSDKESKQCKVELENMVTS